MKNPGELSAQFRIVDAVASVIPSQVRDGIVLEGTIAPIPNEEKKEDAAKLSKLLKTLKFTDEEISRVTELVATIAAVASIVGWVVAAISTIKEVLTFVGIIGTAKDAVNVALEAIGKKLETIYLHLANTEKKGLYLEALEYRTKMNTVRTDIRNLALSRSEAALSAVRQDVRLLQEAIQKMLAPGNADIPFFRSAYGYTGRATATSHGTHWIDMAWPFYLRRTDGAGVSYAQVDDLAATIWDPGHYLDLLIPAIALRLAALEGAEPAFRSTGWDRGDLIVIYKGLQDFIKKWNYSFLVSTIVGPITPESHPSGGHFIQRNPLTTFLGYSAPSIALCCVDPVSGMSLLDAEFSEGFAVREVDPGDGSFPYWVVDNYEQAIASAYARQSLMMTELRTRCGISRFYELMHSIYALIAGPIRSEFVDMTDAKFSSGHLERVGAEVLDLGIIGAFAGKQGKTYAAVRYRQEVVKRFRFAMARRADESRVQLGYRIKVSVGGGASGQVDFVLCPFSRLNSPLQAVDLFPSGTRAATLKAPQAVVYDVIQTDVFSAAEEDSFEKFGSIPNTGRLIRRAQKRRIFVDPRAGAVQLSLTVTFEFDITDDEQAFFGFANVEVSTEIGASVGGFIAHVEVFETLPPFDPSSGEPPREQLADVATLHFASEFLDTTGEYFIDRDAGYAEMEHRFGRISEQYAKAKQVGVLDPRASVSRRAQVEGSVALFAEAELRKRPEQMRELLAELNVRRAR